MFAGGIPVFQLVALLLKLLLGVAAFTLACLWKPQKGKALFCIFVGIGFLAAPLLECAQYGYVLWAQIQLWNTGGARWGMQDTYSYLYFAIGWVQVLLNFVSAILLIVYAAVRYHANDSTMPSESAANESSSLPASQRWDTDLPASQLVEIARRREWAHAIDCLPAILFWMLFLWGLGGFVVDNNYRYRDAQALVWVLSFFAMCGFLVYMLMKDCIGGVSVGKWFTQCRVVDAQSGTPASVPQTMLRNAIYLLFPLGSFIELAVANFRPDRKRLGDQWAGTTVVHGPAQMIAGVRVWEEVSAKEPEKTPKKHPLDD